MRADFSLTPSPMPGLGGGSPRHGHSGGSAGPSGVCSSFRRGSQHTGSHVGSFLDWPGRGPPYFQPRCAGQTQSYSHAQREAGRSRLAGCPGREGNRCGWKPPPRLPLGEGSRKEENIPKVWVLGWEPWAMERELPLTLGQNSEDTGCIVPTLVTRGHRDSASRLCRKTASWL